MPTGALYVFARMLMRLEEDNAPERMAVVFDDKSGKQTFRAEMYAGVQGDTARSRPRSSQVQMEYFPKIVRGLGWPCSRCPASRPTT